MGTRLFVAFVVIVMALAIIPAINSMLTSIIEDFLIDDLGITGYRAAWWHLFPIIIAGYMLVILPLQIVVGGNVRRFFSRGQGPTPPQE